MILPSLSREPRGIAAEVALVYCRWADGSPGISGTRLAEACKGLSIDWPQNQWQNDISVW